VKYVELATALRNKGYELQYNTYDELNCMLYTIADKGFETEWMRNGYLQIYVRWTAEEGYQYAMARGTGWTDTTIGGILWLLNQFRKKGRKYDGDKLRYDLVPMGVMSKVVNVLTFGAKKYADDNWQHVDNPRKRYYAAMHRHIESWWEGEKVDPETKIHHLAHAICCAMFLIWFDGEDNGTI